MRGLFADLLLGSLRGFDFLLDFPALDDDPVGARFALFCFLAEGASCAAFDDEEEEEEEEEEADAVVRDYLPCARG